MLSIVIIIALVVIINISQVWTPTGGWWVQPKNWKTNTAIGAGVIFCSSVLVFRLSASKERRPIPPRVHIPSQRWCKYAKEDDPSLK